MKTKIVQNQVKPKIYSNGPGTPTSASAVTNSKRVAHNAHPASMKNPMPAPFKEGGGAAKGNDVNKGQKIGVKMPKDYSAIDQGYTRIKM